MLSMLVEGNSVRSIERITGVHRDTILRLMVSVGQRCEEILDGSMRNLPCKEIECDEIWTYVSKKQKRIKADEDELEIGDQYVFVALDPETKLIPTYTVGKRTGATTLEFMWDLKNRIKHRLQLTTDRFVGYFRAVEAAFGADIDYAQLQKVYYSDGNGHREGYSPSDLQGTEITLMTGQPKMEKVCTSYVERQNLTIRMQLRRFTRLTNAFSKKLENLKAALALHFFFYNFCRVHLSLRMTPAMKAGITNRIWNWNDLNAK